MIEKKHRGPANPVPMREITDPFKLPITAISPNIELTSRPKKHRKRKKKTRIGDIVKNDIKVILDVLPEDIHYGLSINQICDNSKLPKSKVESYIDFLLWIQIKQVEIIEEEVRIDRYPPVLCYKKKRRERRPRE